jgi:hypothetical protein
MIIIKNISQISKTIWDKKYIIEKYRPHYFLKISNLHTKNTSILNKMKYIKNSMKINICNNLNSNRTRKITIKIK